MFSRQRISHIASAFVVVLLGASVVAAPAGAQQIAATRVAVVPQSTAEASTIPTAVIEVGAKPSVAAMAVAGTVLGAVGLVAGAYAGANLEDCSRGGEYCGLGGAILGGFTGEAIGVASGVHLAGRRKSWMGDVASSLAVSGAGLMLTMMAGNAVPLLLIPPAQLAVTIARERQQR